MERVEAKRECIRYTQPVFWGEQVRLAAGDQRVSASVKDESLEGIGVHVNCTDELPFRKGQVLRVDNGHIARTGRLAYVRPHDGTGVRLGIHWLPNSAYEDLSR